MSKQNLEKALRRELDLLNNQIDEKIIRGLSYAREAKRHKFIISTLANIKRSQSSNWLARSFSFSLI